MSIENKVAEAVADLRDAAVTKASQHSKAIHNIYEFLGIAEQKRETVGEKILESKSFKDFQKGCAEFARIDLTPNEIKTAITATGAAADPLTHLDKPFVNEAARRRLWLRDVLPVYQTTEAAIEIPTATTKTVGSPAVQQGQNTSFGESAYTFTDSFIPVETLGHYLPVSKQVMDDSNILSAFINAELLYGLRKVEEDELLNGSGSSNHLHGLLTNATAYSVRSPQLANEADVIRDAMRQVAASDYTPNVIVLNSQDWYDIDTEKASSTDNTYTAGNPRSMGEPSLWGARVIPTESIASGTFLVMDSMKAGILFDREEAAIRISRHDDVNFQKNMLTILASERVALVPMNSLAMVTGSL